MRRLMIFTALLLTFIMGAAYPASASGATVRVDSFEALMDALLDSSTARIELTADIAMDQSIEVDGGIRQLVIDGKGYAVSGSGSLHFAPLISGAKVAVTNLVVEYTGGDAWILVRDEEDRESAFALDRMTFDGDRFIEGPGACVELKDCIINGANDSGALIQAKSLKLLGETFIHGSIGQFADCVRLTDGFYVKDGATVEIRSAGGASPNGESVVALDEDAAYTLERPESFVIAYDGDDLCGHIHDETCDPDDEGICNHVCADENYQCCAQVMATALKQVRFLTAHGYGGEYQVEVEYLDGKAVKWDRLSKINDDSLKGAVSVTITYDKPGNKKIDVEGKIVWEDQQNAYDTRPNSVKVVLCANGKKTDETLKVRKSKFTFEDVDYRDGYDNVIDYTVRLCEDLDAYKTKYDDKDNVITNRLILHTVTVKCVDVLTDEEIDDEESTEIRAPHGARVRVKAAEIDGYALADISEPTMTIKSLDKDRTVTFYYDEMVGFTGIHNFIEEGGPTKYRFNELQVNVFILELDDEDEPILTGCGMFPIATTESSTPFESELLLKKYDDDGELIEYVLGTAVPTPHYTQTYAVDIETGEWIIDSSLDEVAVNVKTIYYSDPTHTSSGGDEITLTTKTVKYGADFEMTFNRNVTAGDGTDVQLNGYRVIVDGEIVKNTSTPETKVSLKEVTEETEIIVAYIAVP